MSALKVSRWPFLAAVAIVAATVSDVVVETVANTGAFGSAYFDNDDSSIVPALVAALLLAATVIGSHVSALARRARGERRDWLAETAAAVAARAPLRDFPTVALMQLAVLFAMESVEQIAATGHVAGGTCWLGAPLAIALSAHLGLGLLCTLIAGWLMRVSVAGFASLVDIALEFVLCALDRRGAAAFIDRRDAQSCGHVQAACVRGISDRAPPLRPIVV